LCRPVIRHGRALRRECIKGRSEVTKVTSLAVALDWKAERLVGIEVRDADAFLPSGLLDQAEDIA